MRWGLKNPFPAAEPETPRRSRNRCRSRDRKRLKRALARRDGRCCWYCGTPFAKSLADATLDHLIPHSVFRTWVQAALVLACEPCNQAKGDQLPQELLRPAPGQFGPGLVPLSAAAPERPEPVELVAA